MHRHDDYGTPQDDVKLCDTAVDQKPVQSYHNSELVLDETILAKAQELADVLSGSSEVLFFREAEQKLKSHEHVQGLIKTIKRKQKEAVAFEQFQNAQKVKQIETEIDTLQNELDAIPLVQQFQQVQSDLNYLLQLVMNVISSRVSEKIQVQLGSETAAPPSNCSE